MGENLNSISQQLTRVVLFLFLVSAASSLCAQDFDYHRDFKELLKKSQEKTSEYYQPKLLARFQNNDSSLSNKDVIALQIGFTLNKNYKPYRLTETERKISGLIAAGEYEKAVLISDSLLKSNPLNFTTLVQRGFAAMKLGRTDADHFRQKTMMLIRALRWSGDGSKEHPYFALGPMDGQTYIRYILGEDIGLMGSGRDANAYFMDMLERKKDGEAEKLFFHINHAAALMFKD